MAQLSDDCFAFDGPLLPVEDAATRMAEQVPVIAETETVPLRDALGRVTVADLKAAINVPPFDNSAVDGYALRHADVSAQGETRLRVSGRIMAGQAAGTGIGAGEATRIFTGAPMPQGADTVYMQEDTRLEGDAVIVPAGLKLGANRRFAGEDIAAGSVAIPAGTRLGPADIALAAAIGVQRIEVRRRVRVALFSTGNELVEPGAPLRSGAIHDSNRYLLLALLQKLGAEISDLGILPDDRAALENAIGGAADMHDLVLTSGGVSAGDADEVKNAVERIGKLVFWRLALKPGRPVAMGVIRGAAFTGLPGNPVAVFVTFLNVVRPLILQLSGAKSEPPAPIPVRAAFSHKKKLGRREYLRVTLRVTGGVAEVHKEHAEGAGLITSMVGSTGLVVLPEVSGGCDPGASVSYLPYAGLL